MSVPYTELEEFPAESPPSYEAGQSYPPQGDQPHPPHGCQPHPPQEGQPHPPQEGQSQPPQWGQPYPPKEGQSQPPQGGQPYPPQGGQPHPPQGYPPQVQGAPTPPNYNAPYGAPQPGPPQPMTQHAVFAFAIGVIVSLSNSQIYLTKDYTEKRPSSTRTTSEKRSEYLWRKTAERERLQRTNQAASGCQKRVHIFGSYDVMKDIPEVKSYVDLFHAAGPRLDGREIDCHSAGYNCDILLTMGADVDMIKGKDAVVFGLSPTQFRNGANGLLRQVVETSPEPGQTWIYFSTETPLRVLKWTSDLNLGRLKYHVLMTYDRDSEVVLPFGYFKPFKRSQEVSYIPEKILPREKGLIAWMASNCHGFWPRMTLINHLQQLLPLDTYGLCGKLECQPKRSAVCNNLMAHYRFYLAAPNSECRDYITEKFWMMSLQYGTVPVVIGAAKKESYERVAPPNSYIHAADFNNLEDFAEYIKRLGSDDAEYTKYYDWRSKGEVVSTFPTKPEVLCQTLPHVKADRKASEWKYLRDSPWYQGCRLSPDKASLGLTKQQEKELFKSLKHWSVWR